MSKNFSALQNKYQKFDDYRIEMSTLLKNSAELEIIPTLRVLHEGLQTLNEQRFVSSIQRSLAQAQTKAAREEVGRIAQREGGLAGATEFGELAKNLEASLTFKTRGQER